MPCKKIWSFSWKLRVRLSSVMWPWFGWEMRINIIPTSQHGHLRTPTSGEGREGLLAHTGPEPKNNLKVKFPLAQKFRTRGGRLFSMVDESVYKRKDYKIVSGQMWSLWPHLPEHINLFCWQMQLRTLFVNNACRQLILSWVTLGCKSQAYPCQTFVNVWILIVRSTSVKTAIKCIFTIYKELLIV